MRVHAQERVATGRIKREELVVLLAHHVANVQENVRTDQDICYVHLVGIF